MLEFPLVLGIMMVILNMQVLHNNRDIYPKMQYYLSGDEVIITTKNLSIINNNLTSHDFFVMQFGIIYILSLLNIFKCIPELTI